MKYRSHDDGIHTNKCAVFKEATGVNNCQLCLDQTGHKFKGGCLVDCMSRGQSTLGCKNTTCPAPPWEMDRMLTSGAMLPVWL